MKKTLDTVSTPGLVLMISKDGRIVCAVVWIEPDTMPSARPMWTIIVPKYETSRIRSRARSIATFLCLRSSAYSRANFSVSSGLAGR